MSRKVRAERSVVGKYEQHKCEYSWRICTIVQHSEGPGPLTASIQIAYFRRFWSKWSQWLLKIHSYFLITESTSKSIFCMITQGGHVLPNRFPGGQHCLFLAVSWSSQKIWALAGRSYSWKKGLAAARMTLWDSICWLSLQGQGHITKVPAGVERFQGACGGAAVDLNFLHFRMTLVLVMFSIGIIMRGQHSS